MVASANSWLGIGRITICNIRNNFYEKLTFTSRARKLVSEETNFHRFLRACLCGTVATGGRRGSIAIGTIDSAHTPTIPNGSLAEGTGRELLGWFNGSMLLLVGSRLLT